jgi:thymidine phosphorylase
VREGDHIAAGEPLFELYADDDEHLVRGRDAIRDAVTISDDQSARAPILLEKITK